MRVADGPGVDIAPQLLTVAPRAVQRVGISVGMRNLEGQRSGMEHFFSSIVAIILALLLATGGESWTGTRGGCSSPSSMAISRIITSTYNDSGLRIVIRENEIVCNSYAYEKMTVLCLYDRCNETSCLPEPVSVVLDILCLDGVWELTHYERVSNSTISTESPNCTDCLDVELFQSRKYPTNPPGLLAYNQTTHCLCKRNTHHAAFIFPFSIVCGLVTHTLYYVGL